jgi:hypothetical protein
MRTEGHNCYICSKPVNLETSITDECGRAMHPDCYQVEFAANDVASFADLEKAAIRVGRLAPHRWRGGGSLVLVIDAIRTALTVVSESCQK